MAPFAPALKLIIKVESIQDFSAAGEALTSKCCCDLARAPVPGCWPRRTGVLGSIPLDRACRVAPVASQIMALPLRAPVCAPVKCAIWQTCSTWADRYRLTQCAHRVFALAVGRWRTNASLHYPHWRHSRPRELATPCSGRLNLTCRLECVRCCRLPQLRRAENGRVDDLGARSRSSERLSRFLSAPDLVGAQQH